MHGPRTRRPPPDPLPSRLAAHALRPRRAVPFPASLIPNPQGAPT